MNIEEIQRLISEKDYEFLRESPLAGNIIMLGLGGSYAYGTNNENSDVDIRGVATNTKRNILTGADFEQVVNVPTDTTVYSFDKIVKLLCSCNPNTIEMLGLKPEHYLYLSDSGYELIRNRKMFLSKVAAYSFGGYANAQLRRLENKAARLTTQSKQEENILRSIECATVDFKRRYFECDEDSIRLYIDKAVNPNMDTEIFMDVHLTHYPLRDYNGLWAEMNNVVCDYNKIGKRNEKAIEQNKLGKHMMHLVRLYLMCFDILENEEIRTFRESEHDLLMSIRNGAYLDNNRQPIPEFYEMIAGFEKRMEYDKNNTSLPEQVNRTMVDDFVESINERVIKGE